MHPCKLRLCKLLWRHASLIKGLLYVKISKIDRKSALKDAFVLCLMFIACAVPFIAVLVCLEFLFKDFWPSGFMELAAFLGGFLFLVLGFYKIGRKRYSSGLVYMVFVSFIVCTPLVVGFALSENSMSTLLLNCSVIFAAMMVAYGLAGLRSKNS